MLQHKNEAEFVAAVLSDPRLDELGVPTAAAGPDR